MSDSKQRLLSFSVKEILGSDKKLNLLYKNPLKNAESLINKAQFKSAMEIYSRILTKINNIEIQERISRNISDIRDIIRRENPELEKSIPKNLKQKSLDLPLKELSESLGGSLTEKLNILKQIETVPEKETPKNFPHSIEKLKPENFPPQTQIEEKLKPENFSPQTKLEEKLKPENFSPLSKDKTEFNPIEFSIEADKVNLQNQKLNVEEKINQTKQNNLQDQKKNFESIEEIFEDELETQKKAPEEKAEVDPKDLDEKLDSLLDDSFSLKKKTDDFKIEDLKPKQEVEESEIYFSEKSNLNKIKLLEEESIRKKRVKSKKDFKDFEGFLNDSETDDYFDQILNPTKKPSSTFEEEFLDINPGKRKKGKGKSLVESIVSNSDLEQEILQEFGSFIKNKNKPEEEHFQTQSEIKSQKVPRSVSEKKLLNESQVSDNEVEFIANNFENPVSEKNSESNQNKVPELKELQNELQFVQKIDKQIVLEENSESKQNKVPELKELQFIKKFDKQIVSDENTKPIFLIQNNEKENALEVVENKIEAKETKLLTNEELQKNKMEEEIFSPPKRFPREIDINDKLSNLYYSEEFQNFKSLPFKDRRSGNERRIKKSENLNNDRRTGIERRISIPDKLKKRAEFLKQWEENYLNQFASSPVPESILDTPAFPGQFKEIEFLPTDSPKYKPREVPTSKLETLDLPIADEKKEVNQKQEDYSKPAPKEFSDRTETTSANTEFVIKEETDLVKIDLPEANSINIIGEKTAENQNPKNEPSKSDNKANEESSKSGKENKANEESSKSGKDNEANEESSKSISDKKESLTSSDSGFEIREIELLKLDLPDPKDYVRSKSGHLVDPFEEKEAPEINIGDTEFPEDLPQSEEELPQVSGLPEITEEPKEQEKIIHGVLELKPPEIDDAPFLTLTYDFSKIPHSYKLSKNYNIMEYSYYKYKPMLMKAQEFARRKMLKNALNYYRVIKSQNIPPELKKMITRNIIDITEFLEKFTMSKGG